MSIKKEKDKNRLATIISGLTGGTTAIFDPVLAVPVWFGSFLLVDNWSLIFSNSETYEALRGAKEKLGRDFQLSCLNNPEELSEADHESFLELTKCIAGVKEEKVQGSVPNGVPIAAWYGINKETTAKKLKDVTDKLGRPLIVSSSSIYVATISTLKGFSSSDIPIDLRIGTPCGVEQGKIIIRESEFDFMIAADAPIIQITSKDGNISFYHRRHIIGKETQSILIKEGEPRTDRPKIYLYPDSSAEFQFRLFKENKGFERCGLPYDIKFSERTLPWMASCEKYMEPGECILSWEPITTTLLSKHENLSVLRGSKYELKISLFVREDHLGNQMLLDSFSAHFISEWNYLSKNINKAWSRLFRDKDFRENFLVGSCKM